MSNKNEVFEYLIDQLRQQLPVADVMGEIKRWSIDRSIAGRGNYTDEENAIIDAYIGLEHNPYKQQCEDLAHEVQSLKNQLRDASAQIKELTCALDCAENEVMCLRSVVDLDPKGAIGYIRRANSAMTDTMRHLYLSKALEELGCKDAPEQSGCRKEDVQECEHSWIIMPGLFLSEGNPNNVPGSELCSKCGKREWDNKEYKPKNDTQECYHNWQFVNGKAPAVCVNCGVTKSSECEHDWEYYYPNGRRCTKCGLVNL